MKTKHLQLISTSIIKQLHFKKDIQVPNIQENLTILKPQLKKLTKILFYAIQKKQKKL